MLSGTACGLLLLLLLLLGGLAVALAMNTFPRLALLALGAVPVLVTLLATNETLVFVPTVPLCFHPSGRGTLASVVFVSSVALKLGPRSSHRYAALPFAGVQHR